MEKSLSRESNWKSDISVFLLGMCALLNLYSTQPVLKKLAEQFSVSLNSSALTISMTTLGVAITAPIAGSISDRIGRRKVMLAAILAMILATFLSMFAPSFWLLLFGRLAQGIATPFVFAVAVAYINETFPLNQAVRLNSVYVAGTAFGGFSGRFFSGMFYDFFKSVAATFVPLVLILGIAFFVTLRWLPVDPNFVANKSRQNVWMGMAKHLKDWRILFTCFVGMSLLFQQVSSFTFGSLRMQESPLNLNTFEVGLVFIVFLVPSVLTPFIGKLILKIGISKAFIITTGIGLAGLLLSLVPNIWLMILGLTASCVAVFAGQSCGLQFVGQHVKSNKSTAVGIYLTSYYLGGTIGGILPAPFFNHFGWPSTVLLIWIVSCLAIFMALLAWRGKNFKNKRIN